MCRLCEPDTVEDLYHCYYGCNNNSEAAQALLSCVQQLGCPTLTARDSLYLSIEVPSHYELACVLLAEIKARANILTMSKFNMVGTLISHHIQDFPT